MIIIIMIMSRVELVDPVLTTVSTMELVWKVESLVAVENSTIQYRIRYRHQQWTTITKYHHTPSQVMINKLLPAEYQHLTSES